MPTAKLTRVRRLGFSKIIASVLPARVGSLRPVFLSCVLRRRATSRRWISSSVE
jgi:hypothetical protein